MNLNYLYSCEHGRDFWNHCSKLWMMHEMKKSLPSAQGIQKGLCCAVLYCATGCVLFGERLLYFWKAPSRLSRGQRYGLHPVLSSWCSLFLRVSWENGHVTVSRFHRPMETQSVKQLIRVSNYELNLFCKKVALVLFSERKKKKKAIQIILKFHSFIH